jgi:hypothetical protein
MLSILYVLYIMKSEETTQMLFWRCPRSPKGAAVSMNLGSSFHFQGPTTHVRKLRSCNLTQLSPAHRFFRHVTIISLLRSVI